jgi:Zn-dependent M28 family amino/carboxypeptidase
VNGGTARGDALAADYTAHHYHQPSDEWHADWDWRGVAQTSYLVHQVGLRLANSREWPNWSADSEFRAARDRTAAERQGGSAPAAAPRKGERG